MFLASDPLTTESDVQLLDCTLREGSYAVDFDFDEEFVVFVLTNLNTSRIPYVEIGHGIGLEADRAGAKAGNISQHRWCELAGSTLPDKPWGMFAQPEFTRLETIAEMSRRGMSFVRIGMEPDRVRQHLGYLARATDLCGQVYLNLMKSSATPVDEFVGMLDGVSPAVAGIYVVDSYGAMLPADAHRYVSALKQHVPVVGFHGHDNLGMANANTMTAVGAGASMVDGTLNGVGRGSGNAAIESLAAIMQLSGADLFDYRGLARLAEHCRANMDVIPEDRGMQVLGGVIGIHSGFFPLVAELAARCGADPARLMEAAASSAASSVRETDIRAAADDLAAAAGGQPGSTTNGVAYRALLDKIPA